MPAHTRTHTHTHTNTHTHIAIEGVETMQSNLSEFRRKLLEMDFDDGVCVCVREI